MPGRHNFRQVPRHCARRIPAHPAGQGEKEAGAQAAPEPAHDLGMKMSLKDEAWRLDPAAYRLRETIQTRYGDMDANAHLNNVAIARLFEEARARMLSRLSSSPEGEDPASMMIVHVSIDYLAEGQYPDDVEAALAVTQIGRSSFRPGLALFQKGRAIAIADCAMVNLSGRRPAAIGADLCASLEALRP
jgi:acyl-CoA thioester hydrolase